MAWRSMFGASWVRRCVVALSIAAVLCPVAFVGAYGLVTLEDKRCFTGCTGKSRAEIESCIFMYTTNDCADESKGGLRVVDGYCVEYRIGALMPIQVLYDKTDVVVTRFASYE